MDSQVTQDRNRSEWKQPAVKRLDVSETMSGFFDFDEETFDNQNRAVGGPQGS